MAERGASPLVAAAAIALGAVALAWVSFYNGYPLVFADTGTYLGQALQRYLGWDRPIFYSFLLYGLHWGITLWTVPFVQGAIVAHLVWLVLRTLDAGGPVRFGATILVLAVATGLPWFVSWIIPDVFTSVVVLALWLLAAVPERLGRVEKLYLVLLATGAIALHQSHVPLAAGLVMVLLVSRWLLSVRRGFGVRDVAIVLAPLVLAVAALMLVNLVGHGRLSLSPFGANFLLARVIYDGPGAATLIEACPEKPWQLCAHLADLPPASRRFPSSDHFLWQADSPFYRMGHPREYAAEAADIVAETLRRHGRWQFGRFVDNAIAQLKSFKTGPAMDFAPWVGTPGPQSVIEAYLPRDREAFLAARQAMGTLDLLPPLRDLHVVVIQASAPLALIALFLFALRGERPGVILVLAIFAAILGNAVLSGGLSAVHDRYTARLAWLLPLAVLTCALGTRAERAPHLSRV